MKKPLLFLTAFVCCVFFNFTMSSDLSGKWSGKLIKADSTDYPLSYNFNLIGDSIAGTATSPLGDFPIEHGKLDTTGIHFMVTVSGLDIYHTGKFYGDSVGMDISVNGSIAHCTLVKNSN